MRTKALFLTAALCAAGGATSMAQVYSVNAVGYVNLSLRALPQGALTMIANPLNGTNNHLNTILPLPNDGSFDGTTIFRFNNGAQTYYEPIQWLSNVGWLTADPGGDAVLTIGPGEGFFIQVFGSSPLNVTFVGEVPQGSLTNPFPGANNLSIKSSQVPQQAPVGDVGPNKPGSLEFPSANGDTLFVFDPLTQGYKEPYGYVQDLGWLSANADDTGLAGPIIPVAGSFFVQAAGTSPLARNWARTFSVN